MTDQAAGYHNLATAGRIPDGHDRDAVFDWAFGGFPYRDGGTRLDTLDRFHASLRWHRLLRTSRFWEDDPALLHRAATSWAAGLWHLGAPIGLSARMATGGLDLRIGAAPSQTSAVLSSFTGNIHEATFASDGGPSLGPYPLPAVLWMTPDPDSDSGVPAMLDRLCSLARTTWSLEIALLPVGREGLRERCAALATLAGVLATDQSRQVQVDPHRSALVEDPVVKRLLAAVERERERGETMLGGGAFSVVVRLSAPDAGQLAAAAGAATGAEHSAGGRWHLIASADEGSPAPVSLVASSETGDLLRPPLRDTLGLPSRRWAPFDEDPEAVQGTGARLSIGRTLQGAELALPLASLTGHVLVTGSSGTGKSSHLAWLLQQLHEMGTPFWVVEPVKNEYRSLPVRSLIIWSPGAPDPGVPWALNPLEVPAGTAVATHLDRLVALFRGTLGLPDPLPHLVECALQRVYEKSGWDLSSNRNIGGRPEETEWPRLSQVIAVCLSLPAELGYEPQVQGNLRAALNARMGGLVRGPRGVIIDGPGQFPTATALSSPVVINLDAIGDDNARSFFMGLLLLRLAEERAADPKAELVHVTVIEEAHRLLGRSNRASGVDADPVGHTAGAFGDLLAEIRATGEGLVIVEQSPSQLVRGALVNTSTKVALRSYDRDDQEALGATMGLEPEQQRVLPGLANHEALIMWEGMDAPVRAIVGARRLAASPPANHPALGNARLVHLPRAVRAAAALLVRCEEADDGAAWQLLHEAVRSEAPGADQETVAQLEVGVVDREVTALSTERGWTRGARLGAVAAVLAHDHSPNHPRSLLLSGVRHHLACQAVCPHGGCLTGELLAPQAQRIAAEGAGAITRMVRDPQERARRLGRRVLEVLPAAAPEAVRRHALACLVVQVFDDWADPATVEELVISTDKAVDAGR